jgi:hypothetical protein
MGVGVEVEPQPRSAIRPEEPAELAGVVLVVGALSLSAAVELSWRVDELIPLARAVAGPGFLLQLELPIRVVVEDRVQRKER